MKKLLLTRLQAGVVFVALFAISVAVRHPLFGQDFTDSWEWLSAHTLLTAQLWDETPASVHHFNLLYTFPGAANRFIDDLWNSGVADAAGNEYYVSMPHLAFLTPYLFFKILGWASTPKSLQIFALVLHLVVCAGMYGLARRITREGAGSRGASLAAAAVLMFAPTALFFYQNAVVGTVLVIPYTLAVLWAADRLLNGESRAERGRIAAWVVLFWALQLGCLTDWQAYFTAFAAAAVAVWRGWRVRAMRGTAVGVVALCSVAVGLAVLLIALQDSRINGLGLFVGTIWGRFAVRSGMGGQGLGLNDPEYYRNMARFYGSYLPFLLLGGGMAYWSWRTDRGVWSRMLERGRVVLAISVLAVLVDHVVLAHHTAQQSFTTINGLVPIAVLVAMGVAAGIESGGVAEGVAGGVRRRVWVAVLGLAACVGISSAEYLAAYRNRPHPFRAAAAVIDRAALPSDILFATGDGFAMKHDDIIPQMLYYLRRNVLVVANEGEARAFLKRRGWRRGLLAKIGKNWVVTGVSVVTSSEAARPAGPPG